MLSWAFSGTISVSLDLGSNNALEKLHFLKHVKTEIKARTFE